MDINDRIAQWQKMTREAPDDMAWFSLGSAYQEAGRPADADPAFAEAIRLNSGLSRAYKERGEVLIALGQTQEAATVLSEGYRVAMRRGDRVVQQAAKTLLEQLGESIPTPPAETVAPVTPGDEFVDRRTGRPGTRMNQPPMRGPLGRFIADHFTQETWREWISQGTKVINELRLDFSNPDHQDVYDQQMKQWLGINDDEVAVGSTAAQPRQAKTEDPHSAAGVEEPLSGSSNRRGAPFVPPEAGGGRSAQGGGLGG